MILMIFLALVFSCSQLDAEILTYDKVFTNLKGLKHYKNNEFSDSEQEFQKNSLNFPHDNRLQYNLGNAQYKSNKLQEAENSYNQALKNSNAENISQIYQNLGNVKFQDKEYKKALNYYRNSLIEDPENSDSRYNYELTSRFLQQQQEQQQQNQDQNQNQEENKEEQEQKQPQEQQDQGDEKQDQEKQNQEQDQEEKQSQEKKSLEQKQQEQEKQDAEKILNALLAKEKEEMKKEKRKINVDKARIGKYW